MNLSSRDLRAVIALIDERNFTRAAQRLHISQPAFSALIHAVEESLGAKLFDRSTRNVNPTPEGLLFEASARRVLTDFDEMVTDFRDHAARRIGRVAIAALPSIAAGWLPAVLAEFTARYPGIDLALYDALADNCKTLLRGSRVDIAVTTLSEQDADLASEVLVSDSFYLVCPKRHALTRSTRIGLQELAQFPFVHLTRNSSVRQHLDATFHPVAMRTLLEVEHLATVAGLVVAGLGITVMPELTLFHFRRPELALRKLPFKGLKRQVHLVRRRNEALSAAAQGLHDLVLQRRPSVGDR